MKLATGTYFLSPLLHTYLSESSGQRKLKIFNIFHPKSVRPNGGNTVGINWVQPSRVSGQGRTGRQFQEHMPEWFWAV